LGGMNLVAIELLEARIKVLENKLEEQHKIAFTTKNQCEALREYLTELQKEDVDEETLKLVQDRFEEHYKKNVEAVAEFEGIKVKIEENEEMIKILEGSA